MANDAGRVEEEFGPEMAKLAVMAKAEELLEALNSVNTDKASEFKEWWNNFVQDL